MALSDFGGVGGGVKNPVPEHLSPFNGLLDQTGVDVPAALRSIALFMNIPSGA